MKYCKVCNKPIHERRVKLGYSDTCVDHSDAFKYVGFVAGAGKVNYEITVVRNKDTAEHMQRLLVTRGAS